MKKEIVMLLSNAFRPDPRPYQEALSLIHEGHKVKILCWDRGEKLPKKETVNGIVVERLRVRSRHGLGTLQILFLGILWLRMLFRLLKEDSDLVWCHDFDTLPVGLVAGIFNSRKKIIFDSHEVYSKMLGRNVWPPMKVFIEWLEKKLVPLADHVVVTCPAMKKLYQSYGVETISIVGSWKRREDYEFNQAVLENERHLLGIRDELVICYIANLGPERIIEPLLKVVEQDPELFLIIGGDGHQKGFVQQAAQQCSRIKYLEYVPEEKVRLYTALSDVIYYGYDKTAGMAAFNSPNKLFEALAAGKAFLGGNFGEMGEILGEEQCGIALDEFDEDHIKEALDVMKKKPHLFDFQERARKAAREKYRWENAEKILQVVIDHSGQSEPLRPLSASQNA